MDRQSALVLSIFFFIVFTLICYYGARITIWSSLAFGCFVSLILLNLFYPVSQATSDQSDYTLVVYGIFQILLILILGTYITLRTLADVRNEPDSFEPDQLENIVDDIPAISFK